MDPANQLLLFSSLKMKSMKLSEGMAVILTRNSPDFYILLQIELSAIFQQATWKRQTKTEYQSDETGTQSKLNAWILENYYYTAGNILCPLSTSMGDINQQLHWTAHKLY